LRYKIFILWAIVASFFFNSCEKAPTDVGSNLLPPNDFINLISVNSTTGNWQQTSKSFQGSSVNFGRSKILLLGSHNGVSSNLLISTFFIIPDSAFNALKADSLNVLSAWMEFQRVYTWGDSNSTFDFSAHRINEYWQHDKFDADSLNSLDFDADNIASNIQVTDSLVIFNVAKNIVQGWLNARIDTTLPKNFGLLLKPADNLDEIIGFPASNGGEFGSLPKFKVQVEKPGEYIDTLATSIIKEDVHVVEGSLTAVGSDKILLQNGLEGRGYLKIDLSGIPKKSVVNKAVLSLHVDSLLTEFGSSFSDSIEVTLFTDSLDLQIIDTTIAPIYLIKNDNNYTGEIHLIVQLLVNGKQNYGFRLRLTDEERSANKVVLDGSTTNIEANKPKLTITYTAIK